MLERRKHERIRKVVSMQDSALAFKWQEWTKDEDRWQKVLDWPRQFDPKKARKT